MPILPAPDAEANLAEYLSVGAAETRLGLSRYLISRNVRPDAWAVSRTGKRYPLFLESTITAHLAGEGS